MATAAGERMPPKDAVRKMISLPPELAEVVEDVRYEGRFPTDQAVLLALVKAGLGAWGVPLPEGEEPPTRPAPRPKRGRRP